MTIYLFIYQLSFHLLLPFLFIFYLSLHLLPFFSFIIYFFIYYLSLHPFYNFHLLSISFFLLSIYLYIHLQVGCWTRRYLRTVFILKPVSSIVEPFIHIIIYLSMHLPLYLSIYPICLSLYLSVHCPSILILYLSLGRVLDKTLPEDRIHIKSSLFQC